MTKPCRILVLCLALIAAGQVSAVAQTQHKLEGRYRLELTSGRYVEGDLQEQPDGSYQVKTKYGAVVTVKKNEVRTIRPLAEVPPSAAGSLAESAGRAGPASERELVSDEEIEALLAGIEATPDEALTGAKRDELMVELPLNEQALQEMKRIAGPDAKVLLKPHFVLVYTAGEESTRKLAARVEAVYRWKVQFMRMLGLPARRSIHKLEVFYFGTYREFLAVGAPPGAAGFYRPDENRSYFFDLITHPEIADAVERSKDKNVPWEERRRLRNRVTRFVEHNNLEVIQHEVSHHIDFNIGLFPRDGLTRPAGIPIWLVEGTTMMFEVPPSAAGASLGALNNDRLHQLRSVFGPRPLSLEEWIWFLFDPDAWRGSRWGEGNSYPLGWAMVYYLWKEHRAGYAEYCKTVYEREENTALTNAQRQAEFENIFGRLDEEWLNKFYKFLEGLQVKKSLLPLGDQQRERSRDRGTPPPRGRGRG